MLLVLAVLWAGIGASARGATNDTFAYAVDPAFRRGFEKLQRDHAAAETGSTASPSDWAPNLKLWVGVKAVEDSKPTVYFVELTTLTPPARDASGKPWQP